MLSSEEEIMMFMKERAMKSDQGLPLLVGKLVGGSALLLAYLDTFLFDHDETSIYAFHLINELLLRD